jgi:hypothetical protein
MKRMSMRTLGGLVLVLSLVSCGDDFTGGDTVDSFIRITDITASAGGGGTGSGIGSVLNSDVASSTGSVWNDNATLTIVSIPKNQNLPATSTELNDVRLERYEVRYFRSDGLNTEGVDVPYRITGPMAGTVPYGGSLDAAITVVRHQAKLEPPLSNLKVYSREWIITTIAEITVHGQTLKGDVARAAGRLQITFANFADD